MVNATFASWDVTLKLVSTSASKMCAEKHWCRKEKFLYFRPHEKVKFCNAIFYNQFKPTFFPLSPCLYLFLPLKVTSQNSN